LVSFVATRAGGDGVNLVVLAIVNYLVAVGAGGENQSVARIVGVVVVTDVGGVIGISLGIVVNVL
jgi:hypothetical protein